MRGGPDVAAPVGAAFGALPPLQPLRAASEGLRAALWMGPDEWLLIAEDAEPGIGAKLEAALAGVPHALVDVSHRQCAIEVSGAGAARLLNAGVPLDLDLAAFPVGMVDADAAAQSRDRAVAPRSGTLPRRDRTLVRPYVAAVLSSSARDQELC